MSNEKLKSIEELEKEKNYVAELREYALTADSRIKYSLERFDVLIISLSSGGLVLVMNLYSNFPHSNKVCLKTAWLLFSVALIVNLLSQITGYYANKYDLDATKMQIQITESIELVDEEFSEKKSELDKADKNKSKFNSATTWLNIASFVALSSGITMLIIFILK